MYDNLCVNKIIHSIIRSKEYMTAALNRIRFRHTDFLSTKDINYVPAFFIALCRYAELHG